MDSQTYEQFKELKGYYTDGQTDALHILNVNSDVSYLYNLNTPFQITYEFCSGINDDDYLNVFTLSPHGNSFSRETMSLHNYNFSHKPSHYHDYYEFMLVLDGIVVQQIEGREYSYTGGSCCLINRNLRHKEKFNASSSILFLGFSISFMKSLLQSANTAYFDNEAEIFNTSFYNFLNRDFKNTGRQAYLDFIPAYNNQTAVQVLKHFAELLIKALISPRFGATASIISNLCNILFYISSEEHYHCSEVELNLNSDYLLFVRMRSLIEENNGQLSRSELSERLNYTGDYLSRIANKYTGMSLHNYCMTFPLKRASELLISTDISVSEIASSLGFSNRTYFYKLFYEKYKMTPREYREAKSFS